MQMTVKCERAVDDYPICWKISPNRLLATWISQYIRRMLLGKQWSIFQLEWNEDLFNATYRPKFSRTEFLTVFTRDLYNKLQLQAIAVGLDIFNDEIIDNSVQY